MPAALDAIIAEVHCGVLNNREDRLALLRGEYGHQRVHAPPEHAAGIQLWRDRGHCRLVSRGRLAAALGAIATVVHCGVLINREDRLALPRSDCGHYNSMFMPHSNMPLESSFRGTVAMVVY